MVTNPINYLTERMIFFARRPCHTQDLENRLIEHNSGETKSIKTRWTIVCKHRHKKIEIVCNARILKNYS